MADDPGVSSATEQEMREEIERLRLLHRISQEFNSSLDLDELLPKVFDTVLSGLAFCSVADPRRGLLEVKRVLGRHGRLRMLEHVRSTRPWKARLQDFFQPAWTWVAGGCHPNRDTERTVEAAGFHIDAEGRRGKGEMRRFVARPLD